MLDRYNSGSSLSYHGSWIWSGAFLNPSKGSGDEHLLMKINYLDLKKHSIQEVEIEG